MGETEFKKIDETKLLEIAEHYFENMVKKHITKTKKLATLSEFQINPFLHKYLSKFVSGESDSEKMAKALLYPRILGSSITTSLGNTLQKFCVHKYTDLGRSLAEGSAVDGIDIEFIDAIDGQKKYCQLKAGPNTINKSQGEVIEGRFKKLLQTAKANGNRTLSSQDCVVGILYGTGDSINNFYKHITNDEMYTVYVGADFWEHLTGYKDFYQRLIDTFTKAVTGKDYSALVTEITEKLAKEIDALKIY